MKKLIALTLLLMSQITHANLIHDMHDITASGEGSVGYTRFEVTTAGIFDIFTMGPTIDPVLYLFEDDGTLDNANFIADNDDGCPTSLCGPAGAFSNSLINEISLDVGFYIAAVSDYGFDRSEAISGFNTNSLTGQVAIVVRAGETDTAGARAVLVPEPSSIALIGLALLGFAGLRRQR